MQARGRRTGTGAARLRRRTKRSPMNVRLHHSIRTRMNAEAQALGLTPTEYLRLLISLSSSLRTGLLKDQKVNAKQFLQIVESPIFGVMVQYMSQIALKSMNTEKTESESDESTDGGPQLPGSVSPSSPQIRQHPSMQAPQRLPGEWYGFPQGPYRSPQAPNEFSGQPRNGASERRPGHPFPQQEGLMPPDLPFGEAW